MTVVGYSFAEAWVSLIRSGRSALVSIGTIAIAFATLGGFLVISVNVQGVLDQWLQAAEMSVSLHDTASEPDRIALETFLKSQPAVAEVEYVSSARALERFRADFPEFRLPGDRSTVARPLQVLRWNSRRFVRELGTPPKRDQGLDPELRNRTQARRIGLHDNRHLYSARTTCSKRDSDGCG